MRLLVIDDDESLRNFLYQQLGSEYVVDLAETAEQGLYLADTNLYQIFVIDINLPDGSGLNVIKKLRQQKNNQPILVLSSYQQPKKIASALKLGADDYLPKPFALVELQARLESLVRRQKLKFTQKTVVGKFVFNFTLKKLFFEKQLVKLNLKEKLILECLFRNVGRIVTKSILVAYAWEQPFLDSNTLEVHISRLRHKIRQTSHQPLIKTCHGQGYTLIQNK